MKRLFVAVLVSEEAKEKIKLLRAGLFRTGADLNLASLSGLHFTLKFLGSVDESKIPEIKQKLNQLAKNTNNFEVLIKGMGVFPDLEKIRVVWIGVENSDLISLMKETDKELVRIKKNDYEKEIPHLTIARVRTEKAKEKLQKFVKKNKDKEFGKIKVEKLILYETKIDLLSGLVYKVVGEFDLGH